jgi:uroporphyrinogen decarboxylase
MDDLHGQCTPGRELDSIDRVLRAVRHQPVDRPPLGELCIDIELVSAFLGRAEAGFAELREFVAILGLDLVCLPTPISPMEALTASPPTLPHPQWIALERWRAESRVFVFTMLNGGFSWGIDAMGFQEFMVALCRGEERVNAILRRAAEANVQLALRAVERGAHAVIIADDIAYRKGTFVPVSFLDNYYFPSLSSLLGEMNAQGVPVFFHSDGDLRNVLHLIVREGFTGLHGLEEAAGLDLAAVKQDYGEQLCLWGNLDPTYLVKSADRNEIERQVHRVMTAGVPGGGFIFGTSSGLFSKMRDENLRWAYEAARTFRAPK